MEMLTNRPESQQRFQWKPNNKNKSSIHILVNTSFKRLKNQCRFRSRSTQAFEKLKQGRFISKSPLPLEQLKMKDMLQPTDVSNLKRFSIIHSL